MTPQEIEALKAERDALAAGLNLAKVVFDILFNLPDAKTKAQCEIEVDTWLRLKAALDATPQQCLRDVQAEAGRAGFVAGFKESGEGFNGEYGASEKRIYQLADEHAAKVRQGGAE